jgi:hypothetical protein
VTDDPIDFSELDPDIDGAHEDVFVHAVMARIGESPSYASSVDLAEVIGALAPRALTAAAVIVGLAIAGMRARQPTVPKTVAESIGIPPAIAQRLTAR